VKMEGHILVCISYGGATVSLCELEWTDMEVQMRTSG